jgi:hypothetical protein
MSWWRRQAQVANWTGMVAVMFPPPVTVIDVDMPVPACAVAVNAPDEDAGETVTRLVFALTALNIPP